MMRFIHVMTVLLALMCAGPVLAQAQLDLPPGYWERVRAEKKAWVAQHMDLTPEEERRFWPVYESYQKDLRPLDRRLLDVLETFARHYRAESLSDEMAGKLLAEWLSIEEDEVRLRKTYAQKLSTILPGRKVARYIQIESRMRTVIRFELAQKFPLAGDRPKARAQSPGK